MPGIFAISPRPGLLSDIGDSIEVVCARAGRRSLLVAASLLLRGKIVNLIGAKKALIVLAAMATLVAAIF